MKLGLPLIPAFGSVFILQHSSRYILQWLEGPGAVGIYAVGVYEIVYWVGGKPDHQWQYVNAGTTGAAAAGGGSLYCAY